MKSGDVFAATNQPALRLPEPAITLSHAASKRYGEQQRHAKVSTRIRLLWLFPKPAPSSHDHDATAEIAGKPHNWCLRLYQSPSLPLSNARSPWLLPFRVLAGQLPPPAAGVLRISPSKRVITALPCLILGSRHVPSVLSLKFFPPSSFTGQGGLEVGLVLDATTTAGVVLV
jgi:hypothetical protein